MIQINRKQITIPKDTVCKILFNNLNTQIYFKITDTTVVNGITYTGDTAGEYYDPLCQNENISIFFFSFLKINDISKTTIKNCTINDVKNISFTILHVPYIIIDNVIYYKINCNKL